MEFPEKAFSKEIITSFVFSADVDRDSGKMMFWFYEINRNEFAMQRLNNFNTSLKLKRRQALHNIVV